MTQRYAAYGSNLHPLRLELRTPSAKLLGTDFHPGYSLRFHKLSRDASGKCGIFEGSTGVWFAVYELKRDDRRKLDAIEGVGAGYEIGVISLPEFGDCFTYIPSEDHVSAELRPYDWYREIVLQGCRYHGFPADYCKRIAATNIVDDPDAERRHNNAEILNRLRK